MVKIKIATAQSPCLNEKKVIIHHKLAGSINLIEISSLDYNIGAVNLVCFMDALMYKNEYMIYSCFDTQSKISRC
ncbi:MAG: hypothetical protein IPO27_04690 [Bacteroidetes bacterium]|nr:hypothetical protein [Bacteroidota bacterium]